MSIFRKANSWSSPAPVDPASPRSPSTRSTRRDSAAMWSRSRPTHASFLISWKNPMSIRSKASVPPSRSNNAAADSTRARPSPPPPRSTITSASSGPPPASRMTRNPASPSNAWAPPTSCKHCAHSRKAARSHCFHPYQKRNSPTPHAYSPTSSARASSACASMAKFLKSKMQNGRKDPSNWKLSSTAL